MDIESKALGWRGVWHWCKRAGRGWDRLAQHAAAIATVVAVWFLWIGYRDVIKPEFDKKEAQRLYQEATDQRLKAEKQTTEIEAQYKIAKVDLEKIRKEIAQANAARFEAIEARDQALKDQAARSYEDRYRDTVRVLKRAAIEQCLDVDSYGRGFYYCLRRVRDSLSRLKNLQTEDATRFEQWIAAIASIDSASRDFLQRMASENSGQAFVSDPDNSLRGLVASSRLLIFEEAAQRLIARQDPPDLSKQVDVNEYLVALQRGYGSRSDRLRRGDVDLDFIGAPVVLARGGRPTLSWWSYNTTSCTSGGDWGGSGLATQGTQTLGPIQVTSTFTLMCDGPNGEKTPVRSLTITVR